LILFREGRKSRTGERKREKGTTIPFALASRKGDAPPLLVDGEKERRGGIVLLHPKSGHQPFGEQTIRKKKGRGRHRFGKEKISKKKFPIS